MYVCSLLTIKLLQLFLIRAVLVALVAPAALVRLDVVVAVHVALEGDLAHEALAADAALELLLLLREQ